MNKKRKLSSMDKWLIAERLKPDPRLHPVTDDMIIHKADTRIPVDVILAYYAEPNDRHERLPERLRKREPI